MTKQKTSAGESNANFIRVAALAELKAKNCIVVRGEDRPIAVFYNDGKIHAVDNRCPHLGFPLHKGTVSDGILTCHWHHARFDLSSGCTFDIFAGDVPTTKTEIRDGEVWVASQFPTDNREREKRQLQEGMARSVGLGIGKATIALLQAGAPVSDIVREGALFGAQNRDGWSPGMTILTALANIAPPLPEEEKFLALYLGLSAVASDCNGQPPRRQRHALEDTKVSLETLKRWFRYWSTVRHRDAAERTLLSAIEIATPAQLTDLLLSAATDRFYADAGHTLDFVNKSLEVLDVIGWEYSRQILPTVVRGLVASLGGEETNSWRHPLDLVPLLEAAFEQLPAWVENGTNKNWSSETTLAHEILSDDPQHIISALQSAICAGAKPLQCSKALCYAAALRIARFGTANEFGDWITALHTFTYCNALHQSLKRIAGDGGDDGHFSDATRGIFHGAMSVYLDRFLNVPPAPLPQKFDDEPEDAETLRAKFLDLLDTQQRVDAGAQVVARYLSLGYSIDELIATFARAVVREDAEFHTFQMLEASVQQWKEWGNCDEGTHILIALARYLAAHSPTQRTQLQTAMIALRLHRGEALYEDDDAS
jgi:nitrite reductase/ring-hydroxylating ferredoxin subunit